MLDISIARVAFDIIKAVISNGHGRNKDGKEIIAEAEKLFLRDFDFQDLSVIRFSLEIVQAAISGGDGRRKGEKASIEEIEDLFIKSLVQDCSSLTPEYFKGQFSYLNPNREQSDIRGFGRCWRNSELIGDAISSVLPVILDAGNGYVPNAEYFTLDKDSRRWKRLPAYPPIPDLFPEKLGFKPWFAVLSDSIGIFLYFYYPEEPQGIIEIPYEGIDLMGFKIYWRHGTPGLSDILQSVYLEWVIRTYICWERPEKWMPDVGCCAK